MKENHILFNPYSLKNHKRTNSFRRNSKSEFVDLEEEPLPLPHKLPSVISSKDIRSPDRVNGVLPKYTNNSCQNSAHKQRSFNGVESSDSNLKSK